ncbi:unnamed protein product [Phytophthora fragariaefolia]|uniref:Unnamed protein product n=1 Tax=Phytophthora fragariaefolia TaxID=1490495 RepID=A0A9W6YP25_9STRA|nr:unnamed protein product [Phytophthora fragariaefolia]
MSSITRAVLDLKPPPNFAYVTNTVMRRVRGSSGSTDHSWLHLARVTRNWDPNTQRPQNRCGATPQCTHGWDLEDSALFRSYVPEEPLGLSTVFYIPIQMSSITRAVLDLKPPPNFAYVTNTVMRRVRGSSGSTVDALKLRQPSALTLKHTHPIP